LGQKGTRINFYSAYTFDDGFDVLNDANTYYKGTVKGGYQWGRGLEYSFNPQSSAKFCTYTDLLQYLLLLSLELVARPELKISILAMIL
jgi:hypothetical protein